MKRRGLTIETGDRPPVKYEGMSEGVKCDDDIRSKDYGGQYAYIFPAYHEKRKMIQSLRFENKCDRMVF